MIKAFIKFYLLLKKHQNSAIPFLLILTILGGSEVYYLYYNQSAIQAFINSLSLLALDTKYPEDLTQANPYYQLIFLFSFSGFLTAFFSITLMFLSHYSNRLLFLSSSKKGEHIIVFGLNEHNHIYIQSELDENRECNIVIVEHDESNPLLSYYQDRGIACVITSSYDAHFITSLNLAKAKHLLISTTDDIANIEIAIEVLKTRDDVKIFIELQDRALRYYHKSKGILQGKNIKVYSYIEDASRALFQNIDIDASNSDIINSSNDFAIAIVGNSKLSYEIIAQACVMGQLPHQNHLHIYCIDKNVTRFKDAVELNFLSISQVPNVSLHYIELNYQQKEYYHNEVWSTPLTNIILADSNSKVNLDIAANLANITYLNNIADNSFTCNIILALEQEFSLKDSITKNSHYLNNFHIFANAKDICHKKYLIDGERDKRAKATHDIYLKQNEISSWDNLDYFLKESNRSSADHIKIKQKFLALDRSDEAKELLAECEHNRWNAFYFLQGFNYNQEKNLAKRQHPCLVEYAQLSHEIQEYDREMVKNIEKILQKEKNAKKS